jgi:hypothetical protein
MGGTMKQYRIAILGKWETYPSYFLLGSLQGIFLNGGLARPISLEKNNMNEVLEQLDFFKPHAILTHTIFDNKPHRNQLFNVLRTFKNKGVKVFYHAGDARTEPRYPGPVNDFIDCVLLNHWPMLPNYQVWKVPCVHWPYMALNQDKIASPIPLYKCDLAFTGSLANNQHHAPRARFIQQLVAIFQDTNKTLKVFPTPETGNTRFQTPELAASAGAVLGFQMGLDIPGYQDVRPYQYIGAGAFYMHDKHSSMDLIFQDGIHYVSFKRDDAEDFHKKWLYYNKNIDKYNKIKQEGFKYCQRYHSSKERIKQIINIIEGKEYKVEYVKRVV